MKKWVICFCSLLLICMISLGMTGCSPKTNLNPDTPVTITIWHYYNGEQERAFKKLVEEFNQTEGVEKGIIVESLNYGSVTELGNSVLSAAREEVGAEEMPSLFMAYADTAYEIDKLDKLVSLDTYFTEEELSTYVPGYLEEGRFDGTNLKIFPIAKSTEIFMMNQNAWDEFAQATGTSLDELDTIEGVSAVAERYYEYTDSLTDEIEDGKAFFGRDALANYMLIGAKQLGHNLIDIDSSGTTVVDFHKDTIRKLWDNYYVPYINGYFLAKGRFRTDDIKMDNIAACVCSVAGATYFPETVVLEDDSSSDIDAVVLPAPKFEGGEAAAVQQGAGMAITKSTPAEEEACAVFLKWFTQEEQNIEFTVESGYLPVKSGAYEDQKIMNEYEIDSPKMKQVISTAVETVSENQLYTFKVVENGTEIRSILETSMSDAAKADREAVLQLMKKGMSREEAVSKFDTDKNFETWYAKTLKALQDAAK